MRKRMEKCTQCKGDHMLRELKKKKLCGYADVEVFQLRNTRYASEAYSSEGQINVQLPTWALVKGIRENKNIWYRRKGENWWREEKKRDSPCAYTAQMSGGNCAGGLFCRHLPACSTILFFFPAALVLRRAQHNPDRYITKGPTRVTLNFRLPLPVWCTSWDDNEDSCSWTPRVHHISGMDKWRKGLSGPFLVAAISHSSIFQLFSKRLRLFQLWTPPVQHSPSGRLPTHCSKHLIALNCDLRYFSYWSNPVATQLFFFFNFSNKTGTLLRNTVDLSFIKMINNVLCLLTLPEIQVFD